MNMAIQANPFFSSTSLLVLALLMNCLGTSSPMQFNRTHFPAAFIFGAGSSAYQSEGAAHIQGKGPSIWDTFTKTYPEKIADKSTGDEAEDLYHRYKEDIKLMKKIGLGSFRFSIAWSRVLPKGKVSGGVNPVGVKFYNNLIDQLLSNGITPFVTLFHWDVPQALEDEYGGFLSSKIVEDYRNYADFCFKTFGDRVKQWCSINEPHTFTMYGYNDGTFAPGRCSDSVGSCTAGNSATEPYIVGHHLLLSHAAAVQLYKQKYQAHQNGIIGITLQTRWYIPKNKSATAIKAATRALDFAFGWFADPITYGDYPKSMRDYVGERLPKFTADEVKQLVGSFDFLGVNYYTANYAQDAPWGLNYVNKSYSKDIHVVFSADMNGTPIGTPTDMDWLYIYPEGLYDLMLYIKQKYKNPTIYITENGLAYNATSRTKENLINDTTRITYHRSHLSSLLRAIKEGVKVKGYYAWSFMDDFEWGSGYTMGFGMVYVDFKHQLTRSLKLSARWWAKFLHQ